MKVAMLAPVCWRTPPRHYGPWEQVVSNVTEGLVARGVDVTLFATGDSVTNAKLSWVCPRPFYEDPSLDPKVWEYMHISACYERAGEFDLIHNQYDFMGLCYSRLVRTPVITTLHGFSSPRILPLYEKYNGHAGYVSISLADRAPQLDYVANVYNGIDPARFTFSPKPGDYLAWLGRVSDEKGVWEAIQVARRAGMRLVIAGIIQHQDYFDERVKPLVDGRQVEFIGPVGPEERNALLSQAYATLHLINFNEPFGLTMIESMACGTPVIASNRGSVPEVLEDGVTGFIVSRERPVEEALARLGEVARLDRAACRQRVQRLFSLDAQAEGYLAAYQRHLAARG